MKNNAARAQWRRTAAVTAVGCLAIVNQGCEPRGTLLDKEISALGSASLVISQVFGGGGNSGS